MQVEHPAGQRGDGLAAEEVEDRVQGVEYEQNGSQSLGLVVPNHTVCR